MRNFLFLIIGVKDDSAIKSRGTVLIPGSVQQVDKTGGKEIQGGYKLKIVGYTVLKNDVIDLILPPDERSQGYIENHINICPDMRPTNYYRFLENPRGGGEPWTRKK